MGHDEPANITLVADSDPAEVEKAQAQRDLSWDTRELAANLLRIIRGAGKPYLLPQQIINLGEQILETHKSARAWAIWSAMQEALQDGVPGGWEASEAENGEGTIVQGSLQVAASRLVKQHAQEAAGSRQIEDGIRDLERHEEQQRRKWAEESAQAFAAARSRPKRKPAKPRVVKPELPNRSPPQQVANADDDQRTSTVEFMRRRKRDMRGEE